MATRGGGGVRYVVRSLVWVGWLAWWGPGRSERARNSSLWPGRSILGICWFLSHEVKKTPRHAYRSTDLVATMTIIATANGLGSVLGPKRAIASNCALCMAVTEEALEASTTLRRDAARRARAYIRQPAGPTRRIRKQTLVQFGAANTRRPPHPSPSV